MDVPSNKGTGNERRRFHRYPCALRVDLRGKGTLVFTARTQDICEGGLLIDLTGLPGTDALQISDRLTLILYLPDQQPDTTDQVLIPSEIVRLDEAGAGIRFLPGLKQSIKAIQDYLSSMGEAAEPHARIDQQTAREAQEVLQQIDAQQLREVAGGLIDSMERTLWEATEEAGSDADRTAIAGSAMLLGPARREEVIQRLIEQLKQASTARQAPTDDGDDGLSLLEQQAFESWLDQRAMIDRLEHDLSEPLKILRGQAAAAFGDDERVLMQPQRLAHALQALASDIGIGQQAMHTCFRAMKRDIPQLLGSYYRDVSREFENIGVQPVGVDTHTRRIRSRAAAHNRQATPGGDTDNSTPAMAAASGEKITSDTLIELLSNLPTEALKQWNAEDSGASLKAKVIELMAQQSDAAMQQPFEQQLDDRLQATDRVLAHILDPIATSEKGHDWVSRLTPHILTAALQDPAFFKVPQHPLLEIVSQLEHLALFSGSGEQASLAQIEELLQQTLSVAMDHPEDFSPIIDELADLERQLASRYQKNVARAIARLEGQERMEMAHRAVGILFNDRLSGQQAHRSVQALIDQVWRNYLELIHLREGTQGDLWKEAVDTLLAIHQCCGGDAHGDHADTPPLKTLLERIHAGLVYIGFDQTLGKRLLKDLRDAGRRHSAGLVTADEFSLFQAVPISPVAAQGMPDIPGIDAQAWAYTLNRIDDISIGDAIAVKTRDTTQHARLFWRSQDGGKLGFANAQGQQTHIFARPELADLTLRKHVTIHAVDQRGVAEQATDKTLDELQQRISYHQTHDPLTGLANQQQLIGRLGEILSGDLPTGSHTLLVLLEIDQHELIRSEVGYAAGDALVKLVSQSLQTRFEDHACLAAMANGRLAMITRIAAGDDISAVETSIQEALAGQDFIWEGAAHSVTLSIGISRIDRNHEAPDTFLSEAHLACSTVSDAGGNNTLWFTAEDTRIAEKLDSLHWHQLVQETLAHKRIKLRGQLIAPIDRHSGLRPHYEVLLNAYDADEQPLHLERFIATAEAYRLMAEVDRLVIATAVAWVAENLETAQAIGGLAINLSGQSMSDPGLIDFIKQTFQAHLVSAAHFSFEVTETAAIASLDRATAIIEGIKSLGCQVALDDFGTGLSSYTYLKELPVDYVKIDGSFIKNILKDPHDQAIVRSMNEVAHFMGMKTIAEYVENDLIHSRLGQIGVDYAQGYGLEKPMLLTELASRSHLLTEQPPAELTADHNS